MQNNGDILRENSLYIYPELYFKDLDEQMYFELNSYNGLNLQNKKVKCNIEFL